MKEWIKGIIERRRILDYEKQSLPFYLRLLKLVKIQPGDLLLDVGCGACPLLTLKERSYRLVGLDMSERVLEIARERAKGKKGVSLVEADGLKLPFENNSFDAVIACSFPQDIPGFTTILPDEMARVLKPGRKLAILEDVFVRTGRRLDICWRLEKLGFPDVDIERSSGIIHATKPDILPVRHTWNDPGSSE